MLRALRLAALVWLTLLAFAGVGGDANARQDAAPIRAIALADLPPEARAVLQLIARGGPFPYPHKDGSTFNYFEKRLPPQPRGYYREYTVPTPGRPDRGARRIVAGAHPGGPPAEYYYTADHYRSFRRIVEH